MNGQKRIDKNHPDYDTYIKKCKELAEEQDIESQNISPSGGKDGILGDVHKKYAQKLKRLQVEYAHLFRE